MPSGPISCCKGTEVVVRVAGVRSGVGSSMRRTCPNEEQEPTDEFYDRDAVDYPQQIQNKC